MTRVTKPSDNFKKQYLDEYLNTWWKIYTKNQEHREADAIRLVIEHLGFEVKALK